MNKISIITGCCLFLSSAVLQASQLWIENAVTTVLASKKITDVRPFNRRVVSADLSDIRLSLKRAEHARARAVDNSLTIPLPDGSSERYRVEESPIMSAGLAEQYPDVKTYKIRGIDSPSSSGRVGVTPFGFHAYIYTDKGLVLIDPAVGAAADTTETTVSQYSSYYKKDFAVANKHLMKDFSCGLLDKPDESLIGSESFSEEVTTDSRLRAKTTGGLQTYELAISTTVQYANKIAGNVNLDAVITEATRDAVMLEIFTAINSVNEIFERDLAIKLILITNNKDLVGTITEDDGTGGVKDLDNLLEENQTVVDDIIGRSNYDVAHLLAFATNGGLAVLESACFDFPVVGNFKAHGASGSPNPTGNAFYVDILTHELGHQFGAAHSFNGTSGFCADGRNQATAYEPGSGNTIMAYAGICSGENIQSFSDPNFHAGSIDEIIKYTRSGVGNRCDEPDNNPVTIANTSPQVRVGDDIVIPKKTPFILSGTASDAESDTLLLPLMYQWEQMDTGTATDDVSLGTDLGNNPLFKSNPPVSTDSGTFSRTFPNLSSLLSGGADPGEVIPTTARTMDFSLLVKDGSGGVDKADIRVRTTAVAGPFRVLQPNKSITLDVSQPQIIEWDTSCTDQAPVNCTTVDITFSSDGVTPAFDTVLAANVDNDGEQEVFFPSTVTTTAGRIKIMCTDNVFFDVSNVNFSTSTVSGDVLLSTGTGGNSSECVAEPVARRSGSLSSLFLFFFLALASLRFSSRRFNGY